MYGWSVGTVVVIGAALLGIPLFALGVSHMVSAVVIITLAGIGFAIQMGSALRMRSRFEHDLRESQKSHEALMTRVRTLPPKEAINLLLKQLK